MRVMINNYDNADEIDYSIIYHVPSSDYFVHDPGITMLSDGTYLAFIPVWCRKVISQEETGNEKQKVQREFKADKVVINRSADKGNTWKTICELPYAEATPIVIGDDIYLFTQHYQHEAVYFTCSHDGGYTWETAVKVLDLPLWNCQQHMVIRDNKLYWCMDEEHKYFYAVCCDLDQGIMNPEAWRVSKRVTLPDIPENMVFGVKKRGWYRPWPGNMVLESNVVDVNGRMMAIGRVVCDEYGTANFSAVFHIEDTDGELKLTFQQFYPLPGGQCKFNIVEDPITKLYWMASNLPTNTLNLIDYYDLLQKTEYVGGPGNERRILTLWYSLDALNWIPAGIIAKADSMLQAFMYPSMVIDGEDLVMVSRTAVEASCQHDADYATFHRVPNFRKLAMDLSPGIK